MYCACPTWSLLASLVATRWQSASDAERFARWIGVLDRWRDDATFMRLAEREVRAISARHQAGMLLDPRQMLVAYPALVRRYGGVLGARMYGSPGAAAWSIATMPYYLALRGYLKARRSFQRDNNASSREDARD